MKRFYHFIIILLVAVSTTYGQQPRKLDKESSKGKALPDTTLKVKKVDEGNRNILLNATTFQAPRMINIGLPVTDPGDFVIIENDLPVLYANIPQGPQAVWRPGDGAFSRIDMMSARDALIAYGRVGYVTNSYLQNGYTPTFEPGLGLIPPKDFQGGINYKTNAFGMHQTDMTISGAIGKGWYYSMNTWQSFDPGYTDIPFHTLNNRLSMYRASISKVFDNNKGDITVSYRYARTYDLFPVTGSSPFMYNGPEKIGHVNDVQWGTDYYGVADGNIVWRDLLTGEYHQQNVYDLSKDYSSNVQMLLHYNFDNGWKLKASARYMDNPETAVPLQVATQIIDLVKTPKPYTYQDGTAYTGRYVQQYLSLNMQGSNRDEFFKAEMSKVFGKHTLNFGLISLFHHGEINNCGSFYDQTVENNPSYLISTANPPAALDGSNAGIANSPYYLMNVAGGYVKGDENRTALYATDDWQILDRFKLNYGFRIERYSVSGQNIATDSYPGFYLGAPSSPIPGETNLVQLQDFSKDWILPSASIALTYNFTRSFGLLADYSYASVGHNLQTWLGAGPSQQPAEDQIKATTVNYGRAGIFFNNSFVELVSALTFLNKPNNSSALTSKYTPLEGDPGYGNADYDNANVSLLQNYDIQTLGWTTDAMIHPFKGFDLHLLVQYMNPLYKNYKITPIYQSANQIMPNPWMTATHTFDYSDNIVTTMPKLTLEIDPSYTYKHYFRVWASFRYYSKTYGNITNTISYAPHWESFAGTDINLNKHFTLFFNVENVFNQLGMTGSIGSTEFLSNEQLDGMLEGGYPLTGNYLRPHTFIFGAKIRL